MDPQSGSFLPGTLEMLILKTLSRRPMHGYGIAETIRQTSAEALKVGEGSLYPALQRLLIDEFVKAEWGLSENNRKAKFYRLTPEGRRRLRHEVKAWEAYAAAVGKVLGATRLPVPEEIG